jgi:hypothetical protein
MRLTRQIFEKCDEHSIDLHNIFVDYTQAFKFVYRKKIIEYLVPTKLVRPIELILEQKLR